MISHAKPQIPQSERRPFGKLLQHRLLSALRMRAGVKDRLTTLGLLLLLSAILLPLGFATNFLKWQPAKLTLADALLLLQLFLMPALVEELLFRVLPLPHTSEEVLQRQKTTSALLALVAFVLYHPLNALTLYPVANPTFFHPTFLFQAALLGVFCTIIYVRSGSIWPGTVLHWIIVASWLFLFGGIALLR